MCKTLRIQHTPAICIPSPPKVYILEGEQTTGKKQIKMQSLLWKRQGLRGKKQRCTDAKESTFQANTAKPGTSLACLSGVPGNCASSLQPWLAVWIYSMCLGKPLKYFSQWGVEVYDRI